MVQQRGLYIIYAATACSHTEIGVCISGLLDSSPLRGITVLFLAQDCVAGGARGVGSHSHLVAVAPSVLSGLLAEIEPFSAL